MEEIYFSNPIEAFAEAIKDGILSVDKSEPNFAANFMYMYTKEGKNFFKNIVTRKYGFDKLSILEACKNV